MNHAWNHAPLQHLWTCTAISSAALLLILALRPLLRRHGDAALVHASWLLLPLALLASLLPFPASPDVAATLARPVSVFSTTLPAAPAQADWFNPETWWRAWLAGACAAAAWAVGLQLRFERRLGPVQPVAATGLYRAAPQPAGCIAAGPLLLGLLRPKIVLPADFEQRYTPPEQALIVAHEQAHLQRGDIYAQALAAAMQVLFWFNPLVHLAAARFRYDLELACDQAVLRQHPHARQTYAGAILKAQLAGSGAPLGCQWQSGHPLKTRIQQLARPAPQRGQRRAAQGLLAACTLAACYGAWAADQAPASAASGASSAAAGSGRRYKVEVTFVKQETASNKTTVKMELAAQAGQKMQIMQGPDSRLGCDIGLELLAASDDRVDLKLPFRCAGETMRTPRLIVGLGQPAEVRFGTKSPDAFEYRFVLVFTAWHEGTPWPQRPARAASGAAPA
jgi:beta-lactamase regulating signal transducer with metallopeptidase domain